MLNWFGFVFLRNVFVKNPKCGPKSRRKKQKITLTPKINKTSLEFKAIIKANSTAKSSDE